MLKKGGCYFKSKDNMMKKISVVCSLKSHIMVRFIIPYSFYSSFMLKNVKPNISLVFVKKDYNMVNIVFKYR